MLAAVHEDRRDDRLVGEAAIDDVVAAQPLHGGRHEADAFRRRHQAQRRLQFAHLAQVAGLQPTVGENGQHMVGVARPRFRRIDDQRLGDNIRQLRRVRVGEYTRNNILKAAVALFAERGYDGTSIRAIVSKARVNQAAINYHFKGKEGLYFEVLKVAFEGYLRFDNFDPERLKDMPREEALRSFVYQQLRPLLARDQMSRYIRIFAWENVRPSKVLTNFVKTGAMPFLASATELVRRFLPPGTSDQDATCAAVCADGSMQRVRTQPRAVRAAAVQPENR